MPGYFDENDKWVELSGPDYVDPRQGNININPSDPYANTYYDPSVAGPGADISGPSMSYDPTTGTNTLYDAGTGQTYGGVFGGSSGSSGLGGLLKSFGNILSGKQKIGGADGVGLDQLMSLFMMAKVLGGGKDYLRPQTGGSKERIKNLVATRTQIPQPAYVPYSGQAVMGGKQLSDVAYTPRAAEGGLMGLAAGGLRNGSFVIPADVVSHFGNGSSEAGMEFLGKKLGATPIKGKGDGMSDSIDTTIDGKQPAKVAHEEAIVSPEKVKALGKGDPKKGAKVLYAMMDRVRKARTGTTKQGKQINPEKFTPGGLAGYAGGGAVAFVDGGTAGSVTNPTSGSSTSSNISEWAGPYVTGMLGQAQALAEQPYQAYQGPLTAGYSPLQQTAFQGYQNYQAPAAIGQAAQTAGGIASQMQGMQYAPTQFGSQFQAPGAYQAGQFNTGLGPVGSVQSYMNPYLQNVVDVQAREAARQSQINQQTDLAKFAQAGAFGGSRDALMRAANQEALNRQIGNIQATGLQSAYDKALAQRMQEAQMGLQAQQMGEQSRQFGAGQAMTGAQLGAQYGLAGQQLGEQSRQFGATYGLQGLQGALQAAQTQGQLGVQQGQLGLQGLSAQLGAGATQRDIEQQGIAAKQAEFEKQRLYPYQQLQFQQSMLQGLPVSTYSNTPTTSNFQDLQNLIAQLQGLGKAAGG